MKLSLSCFEEVHLVLGYKGCLSGEQDGPDEIKSVHDCDFRLVGFSSPGNLFILQVEVGISVYSSFDSNDHHSLSFDLVYPYHPLHTSLDDRGISAVIQWRTLHWKLPNSI